MGRTIGSMILAIRSNSATMACQGCLGQRPLANRWVDRYPWVATCNPGSVQGAPPSAYIIHVHRTAGSLLLPEAAATAACPFASRPCNQCEGQPLAPAKRKNLT